MSGYRFMDGITEYRKDRTTEGQGESSIAPLFQSRAIIIQPCRQTGNQSILGPDLTFGQAYVNQVSLLVFAI